MTRIVGNDARARKRERDKQNQRQRRRRERDAFEELQRRNDLLEQQVKALRGGNNSDVQSLSDTVQQLEKSNRELKERLESVDQFVKSWSNPATPSFIPAKNAGHHHAQNGTNVAMSHTSSPPVSTPGVVTATHMHTAGDYMAVHRAASLPSDWSGSIASPVADRTDVVKIDLKVPEQRLLRILSVPEWERLPVHLSSTGKSFQPSFDPFSAFIERMRTYPESFKYCSPYPSPLDLLYGDSPNELANFIASVTYPNPSRKTEKLAYQWYTYMIVRWMIEPSEENFRRIPLSMRPTVRQLCIPHAPIFDFIVWPQMRDNFIQTGMKYCQAPLFGLLFVTCRIRDTPNADWIVRSSTDAPQIDQTFVNNFSSHENWVILDRFWREYPELVRGMSPDKFMISEQDLV